MNLQFHNLTVKNTFHLSEAKINNIDKDKKRTDGIRTTFYRTIHSITRQRQCDHDYCAPAFSQVNLLQC
jgi:hypothetical protein